MVLVTVWRRCLADCTSTEDARSKKLKHNSRGEAGEIKERIRVRGGTKAQITQRGEERGAEENIESFENKRRVVWITDLLTRSYRNPLLIHVDPAESVANVR